MHEDQLEAWTADTPLRKLLALVRSSADLRDLMPLPSLPACQRSSFSCSTLQLTLFPLNLCMLYAASNGCEERSASRNCERWRNRVKQP